MRKPRVFHVPGWYGFRFYGPGPLCPGYIVWRDVRRHRHLFSERGRHRCARLLAVGWWELWLKS